MRLLRALWSFVRTVCPRYSLSNLKNHCELERSSKGRHGDGAWGHGHAAHR